MIKIKQTKNTHTRFLMSFLHLVISKQFMLYRVLKIQFSILKTLVTHEARNHFPKTAFQTLEYRDQPVNHNIQVSYLLKTLSSQGMLVKQQL